MKSDRLIALLLALQTDGKQSAPALAEQLEVTTRTIYRDIDALSAAGVPVYAERGAHGGIVLADSYRHALGRLDSGELRALFVSSDDVLADVGFVGARSSALKKLASALPANVRTALDHGRSRVHIDARGWSRASVPAAHLTTLRDAVWADRCITIAYRDRGGATSRRTLDPFGLVAKAGIWYLIGRDSEAIKTFRVQRIERVRVLERHFTRPASFDVGAYWKTASEKMPQQGPPYVATVRMHDRGLASATVYLSVESSKRIPKSSPHEYLVRIAFSSLEAAVHETFGWGAEASVVEPQELREEIITRGRALLDRYAQ